MTQNRSLILKNRKITLTEFGHITALHEFDDSIEIANPHGNKLLMKKMYHKWPHALQKCKKFQNAYLTDILKDMTDLGVPIHSVIIEQGWKEIDTIEDYNNALSRIEELEYV